MGRARLTLIAVLVSISTRLNGVQPTEQSSPLPEVLRAHLRVERFAAVTTVAGLPSGVRDGLQRLFGMPTLRLAGPGEEFQVTDVIVKPNLPIRRLIVAGCATDHCLVYYERGGIAHTRYVVLFQTTKSEARFEWGGAAPDGLADPDEVKSAVLSGAVIGQTKYW